MYQVSKLLPIFMVVPLVLLQEAKPQPAQLEPTEIELNFKSDGIDLMGTLFLPRNARRVPAIVLTHGSGPAARAELRPFGERFVRDGVAAFLFDKRGSGASGGSWINASLDDLADDAIAAANFLKTRPEIDGARVGIWGVSQAGWVIPRAISLAPGVFSFAIIVTGGGISPIEVERADYQEALQNLDLSAEQRNAAMFVVEKYFEYLRTGQGRPQLEEAIKSAASEPWSKAINLGRVLPPVAAREKWAWVAVYDPRPDIRKITIPILVMLGGRDRPELAFTTEDRWRRSLQESGNSDATLIVFVNAGHGVTVGGHHLGAGTNSYAPGYFELLDAWVRRHCSQRVTHQSGRDELFSPSHASRLSGVFP